MVYAPYGRLRGFALRLRAIGVLLWHFGQQLFNTRDAPFARRRRDRVIRCQEPLQLSQELRALGIDVRSGGPGWNLPYGTTLSAIHRGVDTRGARGEIT